jgi:hypothetical protein
MSEKSRILRLLNEITPASRSTAIGDSASSANMKATLSRAPIKPGQSATAAPAKPASKPLSGK